MRTRHVLTKGVVVLLALAAAAVALLAVRTHPYAWIDLAVYRWGGGAAPDAGNLYRTLHPELGMPFTYTPFAALCFLLLAQLGLLAPLSWTILSLAALGRLSWLLARHRGAWLADLHVAWPAAAIASAIVLSQPGTATVRLGQVGFLLTWLICEDLLSRSRSAGALTGIAMAIKLTPGAFLLLLLAAGRWRAAAVASATALASIAVGWVALAPESATYWRHLGPDVSTVGDATAADHWSINATVWRVVGQGGNDLLWLLLALPALAGAVMLARRWWLGGMRAGAIGLVGLGSVLASPFSWSHHWIIVAPLFVGLLGAAEGARHRRLAHVLLAAAAGLTMTSAWWHAPRLVLTPIVGSDTAGALAMNAYLLVAAVLLSLAWALRPQQTTDAVPFDDAPGSAIAERPAVGMPA